MANLLREENIDSVMHLAAESHVDRSIDNPEEFIMTIGSARPMEDAARIAYRELTRWLAADYGFDELEAYFLLTQAGRVRVGNMVDPKYTIGTGIAKRIIGL